MTPVAMAIFRCRNSESNRPLTYSVQLFAPCFPAIGTVMFSLQYGA
jgi:hypothetical protein